MTRGLRPYQPVTPANNKYLAKRWDQEIFNTHRQKVAAARAVIDNNPPTVHMHLHIKLKKLQFEAERLATIERDNRILLEKMAHIMRTGGLVDHKKHDYEHKSLNKTKRQRELLRITHENLAILKRLTTKDPHYKHKRWLLEWQINQQYLMNISKYPHPWRQEQSHYISMVQRQSKANKRIKERVIAQDSSPPRQRAANIPSPTRPSSKPNTSPTTTVTRPPTPPTPNNGKGNVKPEPETPSPAPPTPCEIKIKKESDDSVESRPESVDPKELFEKNTTAPLIIFPEIKIEVEDMAGNASRLRLDSDSQSSSSDDDVSYDVTGVINVKEEPQEPASPITITISESDYRQAVDIDLPVVETPSPSRSPDC